MGRRASPPAAQNYAMPNTLLNYTVIVAIDENGDFHIAVPDLPGCSTHGITPNEAFKSLYEVMPLWIESHIQGGNAVPEPKFNYRAAQNIAKTRKMLQGIYDKSRLVLAKEPGNERAALEEVIGLLGPLI